MRLAFPGAMPGVLTMTALLCGCASAGGTAGPFDIGRVWYKHPTTGTVLPCGGEFEPVWNMWGPNSSILMSQIRRYKCGKALQERGYFEVRECKEVRPGTLCVTEGETRWGGSTNP